jgi:hypothetical protein
MRRLTQHQIHQLQMPRLSIQQQQQQECTQQMPLT